MAIIFNYLPSVSGSSTNLSVSPCRDRGEVNVYEHLQGNEMLILLFVTILMQMQ